MRTAGIIAAIVVILIAIVYALRKSGVLNPLMGAPLPESAYKMVEVRMAELEKAGVGENPHGIDTNRWREQIAIKELYDEKKLTNENIAPSTIIFMANYMAQAIASGGSHFHVMLGQQALMNNMTVEQYKQKLMWAEALKKNKVKLK